MNSKKLVSCVKRYVNDSSYRFYINSRFGFYRQMPDDEYIKRKFFLRMGKPLDLEDPQTFNEKLQWLKLYDRKPKYTVMVDKYRVRQYIADKIGEEYLIPLLGVWDDPDEIDFNALPEQFVLKCNHDSGGLCICRDKKQFDIDLAKKKLRMSLKNDYYLSGREWPYKNVPRKIIAEKYMADESGIELKDYKFFCFNGIPKLIQVDYNRFVDHKKKMYTPDWKLMNFQFNYPSDDTVVQKPYCLDEMIKCANILAKDIPFLRVDFYEVCHKIYFGELTFYPASGFGKFTPEKWDYELGSWLQLPGTKT